VARGFRASVGVLMDGLFVLSTKAMTVMIEVRDGKIVAAPPIVRKFKGKSPKRMADWMRKQKGFRASRIEE
jgi:hypothetical protein